MSKIKVAFGRVLFKTLGNLLPQAHSRVRFLGKMGKNIRQQCGKLILAECGNNVNIYPKSSFSSKVHLGDNSDIGYKAQITGTCYIGKDVIMGPDVVIWTTNHQTDNLDIPIKYQGTTEEKPVTIKDGCWICNRVIILPGVTIGEGTIVGAGAVVSKDIPDYAVAVGNPAKVVKYRKKMV